MNGANFDSMIINIVAVIWLAPLGWTKYSFINIYYQGNTGFGLATTRCHGLAAVLQQRWDIYLSAVARIFVFKVRASLIVKILHSFQSSLL